MAHIDLKQRVVQAKLVYYGPGLCGKTTNLEYINQHMAKDQELMSLATEGDRTIFFDFMPIELGQLRGMDVRVKLYTVPGQVRYNETRKMVLKNVDGVVFVADSQPQMMDANLESFDNLFSNLGELNLRSDDLALVLQYNKRDLPDVMSETELDQSLNQRGYPRFLASARTGEGVVETLKEACRQMLRRMMAALPEREDAKTSAAREASRVEALGSLAKREVPEGQPPNGAKAPAPKEQPRAPRHAASPDRRATPPGAPAAPVPPRPPERRPTPRAMPAVPAPPAPPAAPERRATPPGMPVVVAAAPPAAPAPTELEALGATLARIIEQASATERELREELGALRKPKPREADDGAWRTELVQQLCDRLPGKTEVHQMGLTLQQLVDQTVGVDLSALQAQLLHLSVVREELRSLRQSVAEWLERAGAAPAPASVPTDLGELVARVAALPGKADLDRSAQATAEALARIARGLDELKADIAELRQRLDAASRATPQAVTEERWAELAGKLATLPDRTELADLPTKAELAALRAELGQLPTKAELADLAQKLGALPDRAELEALREQVGGLPTKAELARAVQRLAAQKPPAVEAAPKPEPPRPPVETAAAQPAAAKPITEPPAPPVQTTAQPEPKPKTEPPPVSGKAETAAALPGTPPEPKSEPPVPAPEIVPKPATEPPASAAKAQAEPAPKPATEPPVSIAKTEAEPAPKPAAEPPAAAKAEAEPAPTLPAELVVAPPEDNPYKDDPAHQNAARIARVMVSDLWLYLKDRVEEGIRQGDFYQRIGEELADMRGTYESRVPQQVRDQRDYLAPTIEEFLRRKRKQMGLE